MTIDGDQLDAYQDVRSPLVGTLDATVPFQMNTKVHATSADVHDIYLFHYEGLSVYAHLSSLSYARRAARI